MRARESLHLAEHPVERPRELGQFVGTGHGDANGQVPFGDEVDGSSEVAHPACHGAREEGAGDEGDQHRAAEQDGEREEIAAVEVSA